MRLVPLTPDYPLTAFDCGDSDLNRLAFNYYAFGTSRDDVCTQSDIR